MKNVVVMSCIEEEHLRYSRLAFMLQNPPDLIELSTNLRENQVLYFALLVYVSTYGHRSQSIEDPVRVPELHLMVPEVKTG